MKWAYRLCTVFGIVAIFGSASAWGDSKAPQASDHAMALATTAPPARPIHAVLRYNATTAAACRSFSDASSEVCLLLALHVIRLSESAPVDATLKQ